MRYILINGYVLTGFSRSGKCALEITDDGKIEDIYSMKRYDANKYPDVRVIDLEGSYITPGLIDTHIHGMGGYGTEDCSSESLIKMSECLADYGVTSFFPTVYTTKLEKMIEAIQCIAETMGKEKGAIIEGIHIEGPFISPARIGAQDPEGLQVPNLEVFFRLIDAGKGAVKCMTIAPELKGVRKIALAAFKNNIVLLAGHTDATYENMLEGMQCGILHTTHFFNAMSRLHHRNPGVVGTVLIHREMKTEIIPDGIHVHPELVKLVIENKPLDNIVLVTDALAPTGQTDGIKIVNKIEAEVVGGVFVSKENHDLMLGSALTLDQGVRNVISWGIEPEKVIQMATSNPARVYDLKKKGVIIPGYDANIAVFSKDFNLEYLFINGKLLRNNKE